MFDVLKSEQEKAVDFIEKNYENNSFSHAYIVEVKNYNNLELFLNYFVSFTAHRPAYNKCAVRSESS